MYYGMSVPESDQEVIWYCKKSNLVAVTVFKHELYK